MKTSQLSSYALGSLVLYYVLRRIYRIYTSPLRCLPGPPSSSLFWGNLQEVTRLRSAGISQYEKWTEEYGPVVRYHGILGSMNLYTVDIKAISHILTHHYDYQKPKMGRFFLSEILGEGVLVTEGDKHKFQRKVLNPAFGPAQIRQLTSIFVDKSIELRDTWNTVIENSSEDGRARIDVLSWLGKMTLDVIGLAGFNYEFNSINPPNGQPNELNQAFNAIFTQAQPNRNLWRMARARYPLLRSIPTFNTQRQIVKNARETMSRIGTDLLAESKKVAESGQESRGRDLLSLLVKSNMNEKETERMSDEDVLAQIPTFLVAGHETTSTATTWALFALTQYPDVQRRLREHLLSLETSTPTMDELNSLEYLDAFVREALRLYSPVPSTMRVAMKDDVIPLNEPVGGKDYVEVKRGQVVSIGILELNRSKKLWGDDAHEFKPERWLDGNIDTSLPGIWGHMMTFLGGARACIGYRFSLVEMKALLFVLVRQFEFELAVPKEDVRSKATAVQRPYLQSDPKKLSQLPLLIKKYNLSSEMS